MSAINYDKRVKNLISELSRTGHVTHERFPKRSVTLHHNGGVKFSHERVLDIWRTREASAQFDVDFHGDVAQFVRADEYAWGVGNTKGNQETISIEMANSTAAPHWKISAETLASAARLSGWLFAHVVEGSPHPSHRNFFEHNHWFQTACPGPYVHDHWSEILERTQKAYEWFMERK